MTCSTSTKTSAYNLQTQYHLKKWIYSCNVSSVVRCDMTQNYFKFRKIAHWTQKHVLFLRFSFHKITRYSHSRLSSVYIQNIFYRYTFPRWQFLNFFFMVSFLILKFSYGYHSQQGMFPTSPKKKRKTQNTHHQQTHSECTPYTEEAKLLVVMHNINNHFYFTQFILETPSSKNIKFYIWNSKFKNFHFKR